MKQSRVVGGLRRAVSMSQKPVQRWARCPSECDFDSSTEDARGWTGRHPVILFAA